MNGIVVVVVVVIGEAIRFGREQRDARILGYLTLDYDNDNDNDNDRDAEDIPDLTCLGH
jgi:hypothetical protein